MDDVLLLQGEQAVIEMLRGKQLKRFKMADSGGVSLVLGVHVARDRENGTAITNFHDNDTKSILENLGMGSCD